jgi:hypothetical protein
MTVMLLTGKHRYASEAKMRRLLVLLLILCLAASTAASFLSVKANPVIVPSVPAPSGVYLTIDMASPTENATYPNGAINAVFNVTVDGPQLIYGQALQEYLAVASYKGDWMQESKSCPPNIFRPTQFLAYNFSIARIPFGEHDLDFTASARGYFVLENGSSRSYTLEKTVSLRFLVLANPIVEFSSFQNTNFTTSTFPLNFTIDHPAAEMAYCLDGQEFVSISGNTTLRGLSNGRHNVTVYATDEYGYTGASDTLYFNVNVREFPVVPIAFAVVAAAAAGVGLLVYFEKHNSKLT